MNYLKRLLFGAFSTLLLAAGFARAADRLDPVTNDLSKSGQEMRGAPDCVTMCDEVSNAAPDCVTMCDEVSD